jgi:hypothetical protein
MLASLLLAAALPATASPLADLQYLVGSWSCTYRAGAMQMGYHATYAYDRDGHTLRETTAFAGGGGDEELIAYDAPHRVWTAVVIEDQGAVTIMHASGSDPKHIAYRSAYPDASIAVTFDRVSSTAYTLHAKVREGGKTITSVDMCSRSGH